MGKAPVKVLITGAAGMFFTFARSKVTLHPLSVLNKL